MRYLSGWRIHLAKQLLCEGHHSLAEVAEHVGYESEYSFNRAFKTQGGQTSCGLAEESLGPVDGTIETRGASRSLETLRIPPPLKCPSRKVTARYPRWVRECIVRRAGSLAGN